MTTDKHSAQDAQLIHFSGSLAKAHSLSALEQSACYEAQLAISRWINSSAKSTLPPDSPAQLARAAWYARAHQNFQEWLGCGGFGQYDIASNDPAGHDVSVQPAATPGTARPIGTCIDFDIL